MKTRILSTMLVLFAGIAFGQDAMPAMDDTSKKLSDLEMKVNGMASKWKIGGYFTTGVTVDLEDYQAVLNDTLADGTMKGNKPTQLRVNADYADGPFGLKTRVEVRPYYADQANATNLQKYINLVYCFPYLGLLDNMVNIGVGLIRDVDSGLYFAAAGDYGPALLGTITLGSSLEGFSYGTNKTASSTSGSIMDPNFGYYSGLPGMDLVLRPVEGLKLQYILPVPNTTGAGIISVGTQDDLADNVLKAADYNVSYSIKDLGIIKAGFEGADTPSKYNQVWGGFEFRPGFMKDLYAGLAAVEMLDKDYAGIGQDFFVTGKYSAAGITVAEDFGLNIDSKSALAWTSNALVTYTMKDVMPKIDLVPALAFNTTMTGDYYSYVINPKIELMAAGKYAVALGYAYLNASSGTARDVVSISTTVNF